MNLDTLLGLLFLLFFVILPALQSLTRRPGAPPLDLPPFPEEGLPPEPKPRPRPKRPKPTPPPLGEGYSLETLPKEAPKPEPRGEERALKGIATSLDLAQEETGVKKPSRSKLLQIDRKGILSGMVWHEILKPPKGW